MTKYTIILFLLFSVFSAMSQSNYSGCYNDYMKAGQTLYDQEKYSDARNMFSLAVKCKDGNPTVAREKIRLCDEKIKLQESEASEENGNNSITVPEDQDTGFDSDDIGKEETEVETTTRKDSEKQKKLDDMHDGMPCPELPVVTDYDGNSYNTVLIGVQCWMRENLRTTHYADGTEIQQINNPSSDAYPYYALPNGDTSTWAKYGFFYSWTATMRNAYSSKRNPSGVQGVCPNGWHVPSDAEWKQLMTYVESRSQYRCIGNKKKTGKSLADTSGWDTPSKNNECAVGQKQEENNATGFSAVPAGGMKFIPEWIKSVGWSHTGRINRTPYGSEAVFWCATEDNDPGYAQSQAQVFVLDPDWDTPFIPKYTGTFKTSGLSVRCVRD